MSHASSAPAARPFLDQTLYLLREQLPPEEHRMRGVVLSSIAAGAEVNYVWLCRVLNGDTPDPGVRRVQRLHDYLVSLPPPKAWPDIPRPVVTVSAQ